MTEIHGHEVMRMMVTMNTAFSRESLRQAIHQTFGTEVRFYTCSAKGMDADMLISFLEAKGKFRPLGDGFSTQADMICDHE